MIDTQLTEQGVRYPVYQWAGGIGKVEEFLSGRTDFDDDREVSSFENKTLRLAVVQKLAALHSAGLLGRFLNRVTRGYRSHRYSNLGGLKCSNGILF